MKLLITIVALLVLAAPAAFAAKSKGAIGTSGCGLGYMVFGGKDMQILAATTNGTSGNQTFGITTGTLECEQGGRDMAMVNYIQNNKQSLEKDIARGQGDSIGALAQITGCTDASAFSTHLKNHYSEIFPTAEPPAAQITDSIKKSIIANPELASTCAPLS